MFLVTELAAAALLLAFCLRLPQRVHHPCQFVPEPVDLRLLVLEFLITVRRELVHGFLFFGQLRILRLLVVLQLLLQHLLLLGVGS